MVGCSMESFMHKISEVTLSAFVYRLFHEGFFPIIGTNLDGNSTLSMPYRRCNPKSANVMCFTQMVSMPLGTI